MTAVEKGNQTLSSIRDHQCKNAASPPTNKKLTNCFVRKCLITVSSFSPQKIYLMDLSRLPAAKSNKNALGPQRSSGSAEAGYRTFHTSWKLKGSTWDTNPAELLRRHYIMSDTRHIVRSVRPSKSCPASSAEVGAIPAHRKYSTISWDGCSLVTDRNPRLILASGVCTPQTLSFA